MDFKIRLAYRYPEGKERTVKVLYGTVNSKTFAVTFSRIKRTKEDDYMAALSFAATLLQFLKDNKATFLS